MEDIIEYKRVVRIPKTEIPLYAELVYLIRPSLIEKKLKGNNKTIVYGIYCWSGGLSKYIKSNTVVGFDTKTCYGKNYDNTIRFIKMLTRGYTCGDFISNSVPYDYEESETGQVVPTSNHRESKQRFFSIKTDDVTFDESGKPIISGKINGYENLKPVDYFLFEYDVEDTDNSEWGSGTIDVKPDGTFKLTCTDDLVVGKEYGFLFGFSYGNNHYYGEAKFAEIPERPLCPDDNHPHMIDLGLPSGTKWACCNVGATAPEQYGGYYAWGEVNEKSYYDWSTYIHCDGHYYDCHNLGSDIAGTQYDVAHVKWGGSWVMPSHDQQVELLNNCTSTWTTENGVYGRRFTGSSGGSIFLPAAGFRSNGDLDDAGSDGYYWSSTQYPDYSNIAYYLGFHSGYAGWDNSSRSDGQSVRPVVRNKVHP